MCQESKDALANPNLVVKLTRNKNGNVVLYEGHLKDGKIDDSNPISVSWLKIEPSYIKKRRGQGYKDDRVGLNLIERNTAYGMTTTKTTNGWQVTLQGLPSIPFVLVVDKNGHVRGKGTVAGHSRYIRGVYVHATEGGWFSLPKVNYIILITNDIETEKVEHFKVTLVGSKTELENGTYDFDTHEFKGTGEKAALAGDPTTQMKAAKAMSSAESP